MSEEVKSEETTVQEGEEKSVQAPVSEEKKRVKKQYVSSHPAGGWQVKLEGSTKATKRFATKVEAEQYAKELAKKQGTTVVRKKKDGSFQKKR